MEFSKTLPAAQIREFLMSLPANDRLTLAIDELNAMFVPVFEELLYFRRFLITRVLEKAPNFTEEIGEVTNKEVDALHPSLAMHVSLLRSRAFTVCGQSESGRYFTRMHVRNPDGLSPPELVTQLKLLRSLIEACQHRVHEMIRDLYCHALRGQPENLPTIEQMEHEIVVVHWERMLAVRQRIDALMPA